MQLQFQMLMTVGMIAALFVGLVVCLVFFARSRSERIIAFWNWAIVAGVIVCGQLILAVFDLDRLPFTRRAIGFGFWIVNGACVALFMIVLFSHYQRTRKLQK